MGRLRDVCASEAFFARFHLARLTSAQNHTPRSTPSKLRHGEHAERHGRPQRPRGQDLPRLREGGGQIPLHGVQDRVLLREGLPEGGVARAQEGVPPDRAGEGRGKVPTRGPDRGRVRGGRGDGGRDVASGVETNVRRRLTRFGTSPRRASRGAFAGADPTSPRARSATCA